MKTDMLNKIKIMMKHHLYCENSLRLKLETFTSELPVNLRTINLFLWSISLRSDEWWNMSIQMKHSLWNRFQSFGLEIQKLLQIVISCEKSSDFIFWSLALDSVLMTSWLWLMIEFKKMHSSNAYLPYDFYLWVHCPCGPRK